MLSFTTRLGFWMRQCKVLPRISGFGRDSVKFYKKFWVLEGVMLGFIKNPGFLLR